jgi:hypothetical protein
VKRAHGREILRAVAIAITTCECSNHPGKLTLQGGLLVLHRARIVDEKEKVNFIDIVDLNALPNA